MPSWTVVGVLEDCHRPKGRALGLKICGSLNSASSFTGCLFVSTIWNEKVFRKVHELLDCTELEPARFATLLHPNAGVSTRAKIGQDVLVNFGASVGGNVTIHDHVSIGPGCIIGHEATIESYTCIAAGAIIGGNVKIGRNCYIGSGAIIRPQLSIGEGVLIGMGAVVVKDVAPHTTVVGNPALELIH